jgi:cell division protein FtsW (lipid II flippase)
VLAGYTLFWLIQIFLSEYRRLLDYKYTFMVLSIVFLIFTIIFGVEAGGARSWLSLGSFRFQASEFVKVFMVIFLAGYLEENKEILRVGTLKFGRFYLPDWPYLGPLLVVCGFSLLLLVFQKDLGMALLFFVTFLVMVYIATERSYYLLLGLGLFSIGAVLMYYIFPHVQSRILIYLDPWQQIDGGGYQVVQSLFAISGGGIFGMGLGSGFPKLIPAVHTDFIFSLIGEELGLLGVMGILGIYYLLVWKGLRISFNAPDGFGSLLACGFSAILALQTLIIVGGVISVIPLTGIPLPFLSYGGSSFVSNCFLMGILYKVNAESERDVDQHGASMRAVEVDR